MYCLFHKQSQVRCLSKNWEIKDATGIYFEMLTRIIAEDIHLGAAEEMYAIYSEGNLDKLISERLDLVDFDTITETKVFKEEVINKISSLLETGDVEAVLDRSESIAQTPKERLIRDMAIEIIDAAGFTRRQTQSPTKEMTLPDGSRIVIHEEVETLFDSLMSDFAL